MDLLPVLTVEDPGVAKVLRFSFAAMTTKEDHRTAEAVMGQHRLRSR